MLRWDIEVEEERYKIIPFINMFFQGLGVMYRFLITKTTKVKL